MGRDDKQRAAQAVAGGLVGDGVHDARDLRARPDVQPSGRLASRQAGPGPEVRPLTAGREGKGAPPRGDAPLCIVLAGRPGVT